MFLSGASYFIRTDDPNYQPRWPLQQNLVNIGLKGYFSLKYGHEPTAQLKPNFDGMVTRWALSELYQLVPPTDYDGQLSKT